MIKVFCNTCAILLFLFTTTQYSHSSEVSENTYEKIKNIEKLISLSNELVYSSTNEALTHATEAYGLASDVKND
jgi:hypothetical protein